MPPTHPQIFMATRFPVSFIHLFFPVREEITEKEGGKRNSFICRVRSGVVHEFVCQEGGGGEGGDKQTLLR